MINVTEGIEAIEAEVLPPNTELSPGGGSDKMNAKAKRFDLVTANRDFFVFKEALYVADPWPRKLDDLAFDRLCYAVLQSPSIQEIREIKHQLTALAVDRTEELGHLVQMGEAVWDMRALDFVETDLKPVYATSIEPVGDRVAASTFLLSLAKGDKDLAEDYVQALAPLFMSKRPTGVVWFVGDGANGKSSLIDAMYRIIGPFLTSVTTSTLEDGRDVPRLLGILGNLVRESSEARVTDTERYKALGTHEPFYVHKFHSQESYEIKSDFHTVFNANNVPVFSDKTNGTRRRTIIVPFPNRFKEDEDFNNRTFTPDFLGGLLSLLLDGAQRLRDSNYRYSFSETTIRAKGDYDEETNSAEAYLQALRHDGVEAFGNYLNLRNDYDSWCSEHGFVPLGMTNVKRVFKPYVDPKPRTVRLGDKTVKWYFFVDATTLPSDLQRISSSRVGIMAREKSKIIDEATADLDKDIQLLLTDKEDIQ